MDIRTIKITADNVDKVLQSLIDDVDNIEAAEATLGLDIRGMVKLLSELPHNDDLYHNGETVLQHMRWVLADLDGLSTGKDEATKQLLALAAMMHDLGKAYTHGVLPEGKHTFYLHAEKSVQIAEVLLAKHRDQLGDMHGHLLDLVRLHDMFLHLANDRKQQAPGATAYLKRFLQEALYTDGRIETLVALAKADSARSKAEAGVLGRIQGVLEDIAQVESARAKVNDVKEQRKANWYARQDEIRALLEREFPAAVAALPDQSKVYAMLDKAKRIELIQTLRGIIA